MDLRWLSAPEGEVKAAKAGLKKDSHPRQPPHKRVLLGRMNFALMLWYLGIVWVTFGVRIEQFQEGQVRDQDIKDIALTMGILVIWVLVYRWVTLSASRRRRIQAWQQDLTARDNDFEVESSGRVRFASLITGERTAAHASPRFLAPGVEFGNLRAPRVNRREWHYVKVTLPAPLPHLVLDAVAAEDFFLDSRVDVGLAQRLSIGGVFDRSFELYVPAGYGQDAFFVLTPDVMAALVDHAEGYNVEIVDDTLVFFAAGVADFSEPNTWRSIEGLLHGVAPRLQARAEQYRDHRVPGQRSSPTVASFQAALENSESPGEVPAPQIAPGGKRLQMHDYRGGVAMQLRTLGWYLMIVVVYVFPSLLAFAGIMSATAGN